MSQQGYEKVENEHQISDNFWENAERVNQIQSVWATHDDNQNNLQTLRLGSSGWSSRGSSGGSLSSIDEDQSTPPGFLSIELKKRGRLLLNQVFNALETLETDRVFYEVTVEIAPLLPFRQLNRSIDFDSIGVQQMLIESQRQFGIHICFVNAMHSELKRVIVEPPLTKYQLLWKKIEEDAAKAKFALTGKVESPEPISKEMTIKMEAEKRTQAFVGKITSDWENVLCRIEILGNGCIPMKQIQNLDLMPIHLEKLIKVLKEARIGLWLLFIQVQNKNGKDPNLYMNLNNIKSLEKVAVKEGPPKGGYQNKNIRY